MELSQERGASSWLTALPLSSHGFLSLKASFAMLCACGTDGLRKTFQLTAPTVIESFTVEHALSCTRGGYVALRHNELRDLFGDLLRQTSTNVSVEPELQPLSGGRFSKQPQPLTLSVMAHGWTLRQVAFGLPDTRSTSSMFGFSTHWHRLTSMNPSTKHTQTTNSRRCLRTERG